MKRNEADDGWVIENVEGVGHVLLPKCPVCERVVPRVRMTKHHLKTRKVDQHDIEVICRECHSYIHRLFTNKELRATDSTLNTLGSATL